jgi:hypothetical protein
LLEEFLLEAESHEDSNGSIKHHDLFHPLSIPGSEDDNARTYVELLEEYGLEHVSYIDAYQVVTSLY